MRPNWGRLWDARSLEKLSDLWTKMTDLLMACYFSYKTKNKSGWKVA